MSPVRQVPVVFTAQLGISVKKAKLVSKVFKAIKVRRDSVDKSVLLVNMVKWVIEDCPENTV